MGDENNHHGYLGGGFEYFLFSPRSLGKGSNLTSIFFRWVGSTTNQLSSRPGRMIISKLPPPWWWNPPQAPGAKLMALKFLDSEGKGLTGDAVKSMNYAIAMGAKHHGVKTNDIGT